MIVQGNYTHFGFGVRVPLSASAGTPPYTYSILSGGGSIDGAGVFTAPFAVSTTVVQAEDSLGVLATTKLFTGTPFHLVADIIRRELGLNNEQVVLFNQKYTVPNDGTLYVAIELLSSRVFGSTNRMVDASGMEQDQSINVFATLDIAVMSASTQAIYRKDEVVMALDSVYSRQQQELNGFYIAKVSDNIAQLNNIEGSRIPYYSNISVNIQYASRKQTVVPYFDDISEIEIETNP